MPPGPATKAFLTAYDAAGVLLVAADARGSGPLVAGCVLWFTKAVRRDPDPARGEDTKIEAALGDRGRE